MQHTEQFTKALQDATGDSLKKATAEAIEQENKDRSLKILMATSELNSTTLKMWLNDILEISVTLTAERSKLNPSTLHRMLSGETGVQGGFNFAFYMWKIAQDKKTSFSELRRARKDKAKDLRIAELEEKIKLLEANKKC